jgi:peptide/nickel transport system substrate-binding protein
VVRYWNKIGIKASVKNIDQPLWVKRVGTGDVDIAGYTVAGFLWDVDPEWYVPVATNSYWAPLYGQWYSTGGKQGQKPPADIHKLMTLYDQMKTEPNAQKRISLGQQILRMHDENVWMIGTVTEPFTPLIVNADLHNVRPDAVESYRLGHEQSTMLEQVYYANPEKH